jgi:hypothetical protein
MTQKIEILSATVNTKKGTSAKTGKPYEMRDQDAALHDTGAKYPRECKWPLARDQQPYAPGVYVVGNALAVGDFGRLQLARDLVLVEAPRATASAQK